MKLSHIQEEQVLARFRQGDSEAFGQLYRIYWQQVYRFSRLYLKEEASSEDVVQEVFIRLWEVREKIRPEDNFSGFLFTITRNMVFNRFRRNLDPLKYKMSVLAALEESTETESEISARDLSQYIDTLIEQLPPRQRQVFEMSRKQHLSYREIAEQLDLSQKTVEAHLHEALRFLRQNLALLIWFALLNDGSAS